MRCRHCASSLEVKFLDLGYAPPSNAYLSIEELAKPEKRYPLKIMVCTQCWLVQTEDYALADELFTANYAYFSSFSTSWLKHAEKYVIDMVRRFALGANSLVVEVAANDGYLLQYAKERGIPCLGVEPTASTAVTARAKGLEIIEEFFDSRLAAKLAVQGRQADLIVANNVLAHVPAINDFVAGFAVLMKPEGVSTFEFPHLLRLVSENQFDTVYHEHYSYLSLSTVKRIFEQNGLCVFDVEELPTHGGSLRVFAQRTVSGRHAIRASVASILKSEEQSGMDGPDFYTGFQDKVDEVRSSLLTFLIDAKKSGKAVAGYGAAAKGNTLLNYAGVGSNLLAYVVDRNPLKQNMFLPGSRIPVVAEEYLKETRPDYVVILPWNLREEIISQLAYIRDWGGLFVMAVPQLRIE